MAVKDGGKSLQKQKPRATLCEKPFCCKTIRAESKSERDKVIHNCLFSFHMQTSCTESGRNKKALLTI